MGKRAREERGVSVEGEREAVRDCEECRESGCVGGGGRRVGSEGKGAFDRSQRARQRSGARVEEVEQPQRQYTGADKSRIQGHKYDGKRILGESI